jgi:hypothetical protein
MITESTYLLQFDPQVFATTIIINVRLLRLLIACSRYLEVHETKILDLVKNGQQGEIVELEYPKDSRQFKKRARFLARDLT